jgi:hypothetical protein
VESCESHSHHQDGEVWAGTDPQLGETLGERLAKAAMVVTINDDLIM